MSGRKPRALELLVGSSAGRVLGQVETRIAPHVPRRLRALWRQALGRPPLPQPRVPPALVAAAPDSPERVAEILRWRGGPDVVVLPIIDWDFRHQRPQHLAIEIAAAERRVFWIEPASLKRTPPDDPITPFTMTEVVARVSLVSVSAARPLDHFQDALSAGDVVVLARTFERLRREAGIVSATVLVQLPFWAPLALHLRAAFGWRVVYDCMDDHAGFDSNGAAMLAAEERLIADSDLTVVTSKRLREHVGDRARAVVSIPNACAFEDFSRSAPPAAALAEVPLPIIGYFGAISAWFDFDLVRHAAQAHPEWSFVLIGSTWGAGDHADLLAMSNVHFLGEVLYHALPGYLARFDVATIPFCLTPLIAATSPVKFYEYLAAGKPVVASRLPELEAHPELARLADGPEEFTRALEAALHDTSAERIATRRAFAAANTWPQRRADLLQASDATFPLVSIVIVTWNNLRHTRKCLASVFADASWPRYEVVVVDNGSRDGTVRELERVAREHPNVRLILNAENRGFAAANNQALASVAGEYVVLLNNDTVVSAGWLPRLVRVLERDPRIGLVGPVSDAVWNEALQQIERADLARFPAFAERWARDHEDEIYPIRMLAMFCVAGRSAVFREVGPLDERFGIGMFEDDDYAYRVRLAGYRLACAEEVFIHHAGQASFDKLGGREALYEANRRKFDDKWSTRWKPYLADRRLTRHWRAQVAALAAAREASRPCVVILADDEESAAVAVAEQLGRTCARRGALVLVHAEPAELDAQGLVHLSERLLLATVPLEAFEDLRDVVVLALPGRTFETPWIHEPRRVIEVAADWPQRCDEIADDALGTPL